jgi:hypothetical protein
MLIRIRVVTTRRNQREMTMQTLTNNELDMWSFYEPGDWPVAKTNTDFIWFLLSPSTQSMEIIDLDCDHMTIALYGPPGEDGVPGVVRRILDRASIQPGERKLIVAAIYDSYPGIPCERDGGLPEPLPLISMFRGK